MDDPNVPVEQNRLQPYLDELRQFFASRNIPSGKPADIAPFAQRLAEGGEFEEEMGSILRSLVYRESEQMGRGELLALLTEAVGGPGLDAVAPGMQANVRTIFLFLGKALRQQRPSFRPEPDQAAPERSPVPTRLAERVPELPAESHPEPEAAVDLSPYIAAERPVERGESRPALDGHQARERNANTARESQKSVAQPRQLASALASLAMDAEAPGSPLAGDVPAPKQRLPFSPWVPVQEPATPFSPDPSALPAPVPEAAGRATPPRRLPRFGALRRSAASQPEAAPNRPELNGKTRISRSQRLVLLIAGVLALLGLGIYLRRSLLERSHTQAVPTNSAAAPAKTVEEKAVSCSPPPLARSSQSGLDERSRWAHNLLDQKLYDAALPELREIARLDPSYPGIRLDESDALLNLKEPEEARAAVDDQISLSQCLARLPLPALRAYCGLYYPAAPLSGCQAQMEHIRQQAELQAALVHLELGHQAEPGDAADAPTERPGPHHKATRHRRLVRAGPSGRIQ